MIVKFRWLPFLCAILTLPMLSLIADFTVQNNQHLYVKSTNDLRGHQSRNYRLGIPADKQALYFFGGSGMMWSLLNEKDMESIFDNKFIVRNYSHGFQTLIESYAYIKGVGLKRGDMVILHTSTSRVNRVLVDDTRLCSPYFYSVLSDDLIDAYKELNIKPQTVNPLCYVAFLTKQKAIKTIMSNAFRDSKPNYVTNIPQEFERDLFRLNNKKKEIRRAQLWHKRKIFSKRWLEVNKNSLNISVDIIRHIENLVNKAGAQLVVIDTPQNKEWFDRYFEWGDSHEIIYDDLRKKLFRLGVRYHDLRWDPRFTDDDFYDHQHFTQSGRVKLAPIYRDFILKDK